MVHIKEPCLSDCGGIKRQVPGVEAAWRLWARRFRG